MALRRLSGPKPPHKQLAPVFEWFFGLSLTSLVMHLAIMVWSALSVAWK